MGLGQPVEPRARLRWEIETVADRFRGLSEARLAGPIPYLPPRPEGPGGAERPRPAPPVTARRPRGRPQTRAERGIELAQRLADAAAGVAGRYANRAQRAPAVPAISVFAVGEQVAVTGHDLLSELADVRDDDLVWDRDDRMHAIELVILITKELKQVRLAL